MLDSITQSLIQISNVPVLVLMVLILQLGSFRLLRRTGTQFQAVTNHHEPFDFQNRLTSTEIYHQLPSYTSASNRLYTRFFLIDFVFPLVAALFISLLWTAIFQRPDAPFLNQLLRTNAPVFVFLTTLFDWGENICFLLIIQRYPAMIPGCAELGVAFKRLKLLALFVTLILTIVFLTMGVVLVTVDALR